MLNWDKTGLEIFDNIHIDFKLPKWKKREEQSVQGGSDGTSLSRFNTFNRGRTGGVVNGVSLSQINISGSVGTVTIPASSGIKTKEGFFDKLFGRARKRRLLEEERIKEDMSKANFVINEPDKEPSGNQGTSEMSAREFFESVKNSAEELELVKERFDNYEKAIEHLKRTGQEAMLERMQHELELHRAETQLYALGFRKVVTEQNVVEFAKKSCRELRLDWIKNFARSIPEKVIEAKEKIDENLVFDNYVILHFDPYHDGVLKTLAETAAEKDPILFGIISGSNKLYYVADWIDEYCDLTFDKLVEKLGADAINANDITAEVKMEKF